MTYAGLILDGPSKGRRLAHNDDFIRVPVPAAPPATITDQYDPKRDGGGAPSIFTYVHVKLTAFTIDDAEPNDFQFWIDANVPVGQRTIHIMALLLDNYRSM